MALLINNEILTGSVPKECVNPFTGKPDATVLLATEQDADKAVMAARHAFDKGQWSRDGRLRADAMIQFAADVDKNRETLQKVLSRDAGKPTFEADLELTQVINCFKYFGELADKLHGQTVPTDPDHWAMVDRVPLGVVAVITPFNFPLQLWAWRSCAALCAGCTVVWKPAEEVVQSAVAVLPLIQRAFPAGVVNVVPGLGPSVGQRLSAHLQVDKVAFTGSTSTGKLVAQAAAASNLKKVGLELGGKSPVFVLGLPPGQTLDQVCETVHHALFWHAGQCCSAGSRVYVCPQLYDQFVERQVRLAQAKVLGDPSDETTTLGPLISEKQKQTVQAMVEACRESGKCKFLYEGQTPAGAKGSFVAPTVIAASHDDPIARQEIFGPVMVIVRLTSAQTASDDQLIQLCNDSEYGLAAAWFSDDHGRCVRLARRTEAGIVWINTFNVLTPAMPFGGVKMTGGSSDLGIQSVHNYTHVKSVISRL